MRVYVDGKCIECNDLKVVINRDELDKVNLVVKKEEIVIESSGVEGYN